MAGLVVGPVTVFRAVFRAVPCVGGFTCVAGPVAGLWLCLWLILWLGLWLAAGPVAVLGAVAGSFTLPLCPVVFVSAL